MSKAITWGKFKELFKNCSDDTIMNFSFLTSFEDIRKWFEDEVNKEKTEYFKRGYQSCIDDEIKTKYGFEKEDCCLNCRYHFYYGGCALEPVKNSKMKIGTICPLFSK